MECVIDFDNFAERQTILLLIRELRGPHRVEIVKYRERRSDRQNRYYWPCIVNPFGDYLRGQGMTITDEAAHELIKAKLLTVTEVNPGTGEVIGDRVRSTTELDVGEFSDFIERAIQWLDEMFGIKVQAAAEVFK